MHFFLNMNFLIDTRYLIQTLFEALNWW